MSSNTPENPYGQQPSAPYASKPPAYSGQQPGQYGAPATDPGKTMSIIAIILPFVGFSLVGLILGLVAKSKSKKAGYKNTLALVAIIISAVFIVISIIVGIWAINYFTEVAAQLQACVDGADTVTISGQVVDCTTVTNPSVFPRMARTNWCGPSCFGGNFAQRLLPQNRELMSIR